MKRFETNELEELLKQKTDQYLMYPSERVWKNIEKNIQPSQTLTIVAAVLLFLVGASLSVMFNEQKLSRYSPPSGQLAFQLSENRWESTLPSVSIRAELRNKPSVNDVENNRFQNAIELIQTEESETMEHPLQAPIFIPISSERKAMY